MSPKAVILNNWNVMDLIPSFVGEKVFDTGINLPVGEAKYLFA